MDSINKGKRRLLYTIIGLLIFTFISEAYILLRFYSANNGIMQRLPQVSIRFILTCLLCYFMFRGSKVARNIFVGLFGIVISFMAIGAIITVRIYLVDLLLIIVYGTVLFILITDKDIKDFMIYQRENR